MTCPTQTLPMAEVLEKLETLPGWALNDNALERVYQGKTYLDALELLNRIARLADEMDHHPDLLLSWRKLVIRYWTHTANGVTELDFESAHRAERLLSR